MRADLQTAPRLIYLNSANLSLMPPEVLAAQQRHLQEFEANPTEGLRGAWEKLWGVQQRLGAFLGAAPTDLFLRPNVTSVLNTFILGSPLTEGAEIVVGELEYGSVVNICRWRAEREQRPWRVLKMPQTPPALARLTEERLAKAVISQLGPNTGMLVLSHVIASTGLVLPLIPIARACRERGILFVVDGAYAPGALRVNFREWEELDYYGCSLYKWMMGPKGTAFGWVHPSRQAALSPLHAGWTTFGNFAPFNAFGGGSEFQARFCLTGCHDFSPFFAIADLVDFWEREGAERIRTELQRRQTYLEAQVSEKLGWTLLSAPSAYPRGRQSCFVLPETLQVPGPAFLNDAREKRGVQLNTAPLLEKWHAIFSPHIYTSESEISEAIDRLRL